MTKEQRGIEARRYLDEACEILDAMEARSRGIDKLPHSGAVATQMQSIIVAMMLAFIESRGS